MQKEEAEIILTDFQLPGLCDWVDTVQYPGE